MKERNAWLAPYQDNSAMLSHIAKVRERENAEKQRAHFDALRDILGRFSRVYEHAVGECESVLHDVQGLVSMSNDELDACDAAQMREFRDVHAQVLRMLMPWRKGPFRIFDTTIHAEWRSDVKWQRLARIFDIETLCKNKAVLDVGANNLYYSFRILLAGAGLVLATDPLCKYVWYRDFFSILLPRLPLYFEMLGAPLEECFSEMFESIFCMGILYHQRNPLLCLQSLHRALKKNGLLVVETMCLNTEKDICLFPQKTYQNSRGYWFIPSASVVRHWLTRCGFEVLTYDTPVRTTSEEQGSSEWIVTHTLEHFLDSADTRKTVEGYDAPYRCIVVARKK